MEMEKNWGFLWKAGLRLCKITSNKKLFMRKITLSILTFLPLALFAQQQKTLPFDPAVRTGKLANGFTYYIRHNEEPKKKVIMYLVNKVGSVLEDEDQRGLAHFMEHMEFNGTKHFPHNELVDYLQKNGVRFGADINAYTSFDETVYQLPLPTDDPKVVSSGMEIMRDWAQEALLDPTEIDKERGVVLEEKRLGKGAQERMQRQLWPVIFKNSRYAVRLPIGLDTVLHNFKRPAIARFYHDWYRPDLQALIVVGDIDVNEMEKKIKAQFSSLKNPLNEKKRVTYNVPLDGKNYFLAVTDKEMTATVAEVIIKQPKLNLHTAAEYRESIIRQLYNSMLGERFAELSRQANPPFVQGGANISGFIGNLDNFDASVVAKPGELEKGFKAVWTEVERARRFGFTQTELDRAKNDYQNQFASLLKEKNKTNSESYVREYQDHFLHGTASPGISYEYNLVTADLKTIGLADLNTLAETAVKATDRDILVLAPEKDKAGLPNEGTVNSWLKAIENEDLTPYVDKTNTQPLLNSWPVAGKIVAETRDTSLNLITYTLSNGVRVVLKPTTYKDDQVLFSGFSPGGTSLYTDKEYQSAANAGLIPAFGVGNYDPGQLDKFLSGKQVRVGPFIGDRTQGIKGSAEPKDLETAMQLVYAYYTAPRKDTAIFNSILLRSKAGLANRGSDPKSVFQDSVSATLYNNNIRKTGPSIGKINQINLDRAYAIYKERFADAANTTFTFVGNIDTTTIKPLLEKYLAALPASHSGEEARDLGIHIATGKITKNVYKGTEPKATVDLFWSGTYAFSPENNVTLDALKECLEIRLLERLREDESGVYSPGAFVQMSKLPQNRYTFIVQFGCAPQNVDKLIASTLDEVNKLKTTGPLQVNVDKWRAENLRERETEMQTNEFWLGFLTGQQNDNEPYSTVNTFNQRLGNVTVQSVKAAANQYLSGDNFIRMVLLPEPSVASK
jgi:zinc protease